MFLLSKFVVDIREDVNGFESAEKGRICVLVRNEPVVLVVDILKARFEAVRILRKSMCLSSKSMTKSVSNTANICAARDRRAIFS